MNKKNELRIRIDKKLLNEYEQIALINDMKTNDLIIKILTNKISLSEIKINSMDQKEIILEHYKFNQKKIIHFENLILEVEKLLEKIKKLGG